LDRPKTMKEKPSGVYRQWFALIRVPGDHVQTMKWLERRRTCMSFRYSTWR